MKKRKLNSMDDLPANPKYTECYTNLAKDRVIFISENITYEVASSLSAMLLYYDSQKEEEISIYLNTNGGDGMALINIYDVIRLIKSQIKIVCIGRAYSAGSLILAAGSKGKRYITKNSTVMIHGLQTIFPREYDDQKNSEIWYNHIKLLNRTLLATLAENTGKTLEQVLQDCDKDNFMNAEEALAYGIVDEII